MLHHKGYIHTCNKLGISDMYSTLAVAGTLPASWALTLQQVVNLDLHGNEITGRFPDGDPQMRLSRQHVQICKT